MNARAAWRLERLGFTRVYRYPAGKSDWLAAGLPSEGRNADALRAGTIARRVVPTCAPDEPVTEAARRAHQAGSDFCFVVNDERVVLGRLRGAALDEGSDAVAEDVMEEGPITTRANSELLSLATRLHDHDVASVIVSDPDGRLIGVAHRDDADEVLCRKGKPDAVNETAGRHSPGSERSEGGRPVMLLDQPDRPGGAAGRRCRFDEVIGGDRHCQFWSLRLVPARQ